MFAKWRLFPKIATAILCFFMGLMVYVAVVAFTHKSGAIKLDMGQIQHVRYNAEKK